MKTGKLVVLTLVVAALLASACAPAAAPTPPPTLQPAVATPTAAAAPTVAPAPTATPVAAKPTPAVAAPTPTLAPKPAVAQPKYGGILKTSTQADPASYDMHQEVSYTVLHPLAPVYNLLVKMDPKEGKQVVPDLAERWEISPDGKTYTFSLYKGVKFHDGTPLTSTDVKASFDRVLNPPKGLVSPRQAYYKNIVKIETPDDSTIRFTLKQPQGAFLTMAAVPFTVIFPKKLLDEKPDMKRTILGSGPFVFKEHNRGVQWVFEKNPNYFIKGRPYLDGIVRYIILDPAASEAAFKTKRIVLLQQREHKIKGPVLTQLKKALPDMVIQPYPDPVLYAFLPNLTRKPWPDIRVRQAVALALDEAALRDLVEPDSIVGGFMPPGSGWEIPWEELAQMSSFKKPTPEGLAQAKRLLAEAGYADGFSFQWLVRSSSRSYSDLAVIAKGQLEKIGIKSELDIQEDAAFWARRLALTWDAMLYPPVSVEMSDPDVILSRFITDSGGNYNKYSNKKVDELYDKQSATTDPAERKRLVLEIQKLLFEDPAAAPVFWRADYAFHHPEVKGFDNIGLYNGNRLDEVWLAE